MENKYYTPEISEFYVGFEFEIASYGGKMLPGSPTIKEWIQDKLTSDLHDINYILDIYNEGKQCTDIRVKYLDQSDIEELGFEHIESTENGVNFIKYIDNPKQSIHLTLFNANHRVGIAVYNFNVNPPMVCEEIGTFGGIIKNKLELKKVLNMLNIK